MKVMEPTASLETTRLEGTYTEKDLRIFAAFLARRVAGAKIWTLGVVMLLPVYWSGDFRKSWPLMIPIALVIIGFVVLLRFVILPKKLYKSAAQLPGVFEPRCIAIDVHEVSNTSESGGHTFRLEDVQEVITTPEYLFVMVAPKQGIPIPIAWVGDAERVSRLTGRLLSRKITAS
jgi:hypothetical protein